MLLTIWLFTLQVYYQGGKIPPAEHLYIVSFQQATDTDKDN